MVPATISLTDWVWDPPIFIALALLGQGYLLAIGPLRHRIPDSRPIGFWRAASFISGVVLLTVTLVSPLHVIADQFLLSGHMVQHQLLVLVIPPLLLAGTPAWLVDPVLRLPRIGSIMRQVARPLPAFAIFNATMLIWHVPVLYQAALQADFIHRLEHSMFLATALVGWLPVISVSRRLANLAFPLRILYLFFSTMPAQVLGAMIALSTGLIYPWYGLQPRLWGVAPLVDQQLGGLIMWIGGGFYYFFAIAVVFFIWADRQQKEDERSSGRASSVI